MGKELYDIIDSLETCISQGSKVPLIQKVMIQDTAFYTLIDELRAAIPEELKAARRILQEKDRLLAQARVDAAKILEEARKEADKMLGNELLHRQVEEQIATLEAEAEANTQQLKYDADLYVSQILHGLQEQLNEIETDLSRTILGIEKGLEQIHTSKATLHSEATEQAEHVVTFNT